MAVPKSKITRSKRNMRRAHDALVASNLGECPNCGEPKLPHHVCGSCGYYKGQEVVESSDSF
ncbi:MAG: 50S ribosomal protein L32 [Alphaproteobacteria bacterium]|nr:MAG: 50S ribosomal protein L32 [Alphaproteobacteria bacterium]